MLFFVTTYKAVWLYMMFPYHTVDSTSLLKRHMLLNSLHADSSLRLSVLLTYFRVHLLTSSILYLVYLVFPQCLQKLAFIKVDNQRVLNWYQFLNFVMNYKTVHGSVTMFQVCRLAKNVKCKNLKANFQLARYGHIFCLIESIKADWLIDWF